MSALVEIEDGAIATVSKKGPDEARTARKAQALVALAESMEVKTQEDYDLAIGELRTIVAFHAELEEERVGFTGPLNALLTKMNARFQPYLKALRGDGKKDTVSAESIIKGKCNAFLAEQQRKADEERRRAEAVAAAERKRLADEADRVRKEAEAVAEAARKAEEARAAAARAELERKAAAEQAAARGKKAKELAEQRAKEEREAEERRAAHAAQLLADAEEEAARRVAALETTAAVTIAQPSTVVVHKGRGISTPKRLVGVVTDKLALMKFIVEQRPDLAVLFDVNPTALNAQIRLMGQGTSVPGIRVDEQTSISVR